MDARILVMDGKPEIADLIEVCLESEGCTVFKCGTGIEALVAVQNQALDLATLDAMFPGINGSTLCGEIRKGHRFPILMFAARMEDMDKIIGLTIGTDDYVTEPFNPLELVARIEAQLHHYIRYNEADKVGDCRGIIDFNDLVINRAAHECTLYDRELGLTPIEFDVLWMLCESRSQAIFAERLLESVWGGEYLDRNNTVMIHIRHSQEKMDEPPRSPRFIKTVWSVGYKIDQFFSKKQLTKRE